MHGSDKFIGALIVNITSLSLSFKKNIYEVLIINYPYVDAYYVSRILYHCSDVFYIFMCVGRIKIYLFISNIQDIVNSNRDHTFT